MDLCELNYSRCKLGGGADEPFSRSGGNILFECHSQAVLMFASLYVRKHKNLLECTILDG